METLDYFKTLEIVEKFMYVSGFREHCETICQGICCKDCYKSNKEACYLHEQRRLACSVYMCDLRIEPGRLLFPFIAAQIDIMNAIQEIIKSENSGRRKSQFFHKPPESLFTDFAVGAQRVIKGFSLELAIQLSGFTKTAAECWPTIRLRAKKYPHEAKLSAFKGTVNKNGCWRVSHRFL